LDYDRSYDRTSDIVQATVNYKPSAVICYNTNYGFIILTIAMSYIKQATGLTSQDLGQHGVAERDVGLVSGDGADTLAQLQQALVDAVAFDQALALSLSLGGTL